MLYRYETHCHSAQGSRCAVSTAQELVRAYHAAGFAGLVLTDHFIFGNTNIPRDLPWEDRMRCYYQVYLDAKRAAEGLDFDVIFGIEHAYGDGKEILIYGIDLPFLLNNPDIPQISLDEFAARVKAYGGILIQAHPYRNRSYVNMAVGPRSDLVDGIEVHNTGNLPGEDSAGILLPYRVRDEKEFVAALKRRDHAFLVGGHTTDRIQPHYLP